MGLSESVNVITNRWDFVARVENQYSIVRDKRGREGEEYEILMRHGTIQQEQFAIYNMRKTPPEQLVAVYGSQLKSQPGLCAPEPVFRVITQHLCVRFNQSFQLNTQEVLYLLVQSMKGYAFLYSKVGCFVITNKMMGLTAEGELKLWMHEKFGENGPQYPKNSIRTVSQSHYNGVNQQQNFMIKQIFSIISNHAQRGTFERLFGRVNIQGYNFATINNVFIECIQRFNIQRAHRIDIHRKISIP